MSKQIYVLGHVHYASPFRELFETIVAVSPFKLPSDTTSLPTLLLFTGGEDISVSLYEEDKWGNHLAARCNWEIQWFNWAVKHKVPMFGTCRGMQMFTALTGGKLIKHVNNHLGRHKVTTTDGNRFVVNSIHHQMCLPKQGEFHLLAYAHDIIPKEQRPTLYAADLRVGPAGDWVEPEALYFPKVNALGVQWHPEGLPPESEAHEWVIDKVQEYLHI